MDMPRPGAEHKKLAWLAGKWEGDETLYPSPWDPYGGRAKGRYEFRPALDGFYVIGDYRQERGGEVNFRGHAVIGWDVPSQEYVMFWFDSTGFVPSGAPRGTWDGDVLVLTNADQTGHHRYSISVGDNFMTQTIEASPDGEAWSVFLEGTYRRS